MSRDLSTKTTNHGREVNRSAPIGEQLKFAIANKLLLRVSYNEAARVVEPHDYGVQKGREKLLAYQLRRIAGSPRRDVSGWRLLDIEKIGDCEVLDETFRGSRGDSHQRHYKWDLLYARVT